MVFPWFFLPQLASNSRGRALLRDAALPGGGAQPGAGPHGLGAAAEGGDVEMGISSQSTMKYIYIYIYGWYMVWYVYILHTYMHTHTHIYVYINIRIYAHTHIYMYIYIYIILYFKYTYITGLNPVLKPYYI